MSRTRIMDMWCACLKLAKNNGLRNINGKFAYALDMEQIKKLFTLYGFNINSSHRTWESYLATWCEIGIVVHNGPYYVFQTIDIIDMVDLTTEQSNTYYGAFSAARVWREAHEDAEIVGGWA